MDVLDDFLDAFCTIRLAETLSVENTMGKRSYFILLVAANAFLSYGVNFLGWSRLVLLLNYILIFFYILKINSLQANRFDVYLYVFFSVLIVRILKTAVYVPVCMVADRMAVSFDSVPVTAVILTLCCCFIRKRRLLLNTRKRVQRWGRRNYILAAIFCILFIGQIILFKLGKTITLSDGIYILCFAGAFIGFFHKVNISERELELHRQYTAKYTEMIWELQSRQHKFSNQLNAICLMSEVYKTYDELVQKQKEEMEQLKRYLMPGKILVLGRPMVIAHIYEKICQSEEYGIMMKLNISCSLKPVKVSDIYLVEIIGNLIDNAMEEVMERGKGEEIILSIFKNDNKCCISVSNEHDRIPYDEYGHFFDYGYSSKGKGRGQGLPYVRRIVKQYGGSIRSGNVTIKKKNYFFVRVYI